LHLARRESLLSVPSLVRYLRDQAITTITLSPSLLALLPSDDLPSLHTVISAGESCPWEIAARWAPGRRFFNAYGPTEATIGPTLYRVEHLLDATATVPIGRPIANIQVYLLDPHRQPVPIGTPGEIHIGGVGLARGYLNRPDLTAEKFIAVDGGQWTVMHALTTTYSPLPARLYRTGDLARYLSDGNLEFLGRVDQQVKVRGFRIELGEIEATLRTHPGVRDSVVLAREDTPGDRRLAAYIVPHTTSAPAASDLKRFLKDRLPDHMLPSAYMILEAFPLLSSGKVDRKALPAPESTRPDLDVVFVMPRNEIERSIAMIWQEVLNVETVGIHDNFFDLGGHSLLAVKAHSRLQEVFKRDISMVELFKYPTVSALAKFLADGGNGHSVQISRTRAEKQKEAIEQRQKMMRAAANRRTAQRQRNQRD
jgi:acyl-CoA synthetase (AMP-forming)/AMP-acid ligase II/acyl carrier protein